MFPLMISSSNRNRTVSTVYICYSELPSVVLPTNECRVLLVVVVVHRDRGNLGSGYPGTLPGSTIDTRIGQHGIRLPGSQFPIRGTIVLYLFGQGVWMSHSSRHHQWDCNGAGWVNGCTHRCLWRIALSCYSVTSYSQSRSHVSLRVSGTVWRRRFFNLKWNRQFVSI